MNVLAIGAAFSWAVFVMLALSRLQSRVEAIEKHLESMSKNSK